MCSIQKKVGSSQGKHIANANSSFPIPEDGHISGHGFEIAN